MTTDPVYIRLTQIETRLITIEHLLRVLLGPGRRKWWEVVAGSMADIPEDDWRHFQNFCLYIRKTGKDPPEEWDGNDPIPFPPEEPDEEV